MQISQGLSKEPLEDPIKLFIETETLRTDRTSR
jgi:hypothetical protein